VNLNVEFFLCKLGQLREAQRWLRFLGQFQLRQSRAGGIGAIEARPEGRPQTHAGSIFQSGFPIPLLAQSTLLSTNFGDGPPRPNVTAGCGETVSGSAQSRLKGWFNTSCFSQPSTFGFGSEVRVDPRISMSGVNNSNVALFKNSQVTERFRLQFRVEVFNVANRVQFGPPGQTLGTPQFGVVSSQINDQRLIQFGMRLSF
jgi:hypothetical protein